MRSVERLINPSFRRMPESIALHSLDPRMRRDDEKRISQKFLKSPALAAEAGMPESTAGPILTGVHKRAGLIHIE